MPCDSRDTIHVPGEPIQTPFFLIGPTAVGKSRLAVELAERTGGEVIGADAFQIYAGLDILSAKPSPEYRTRVPHHLVGEIPLTTRFDVGQWLSRARECITQITARGNLPIICGGTGLYIRSLAMGLASLPVADLQLRATLEMEPLPLLAERLRALDPASTVDMRNPRRVIRALEVCILTGKPFSSFRAEWASGAGPRGVILTMARDRHRAAIDARTEAMFDAGVVGEVAAIGDVGPTASKMIGLAEIREHLAGKATRRECIDAISLATRQYARRQATWFRSERGIAWIDPSESADPVSILLSHAATHSRGNSGRQSEI
jgi:tRNA dimethylallyltransferase